MNHCRTCRWWGVGQDGPMSHVVAESNEYKSCGNPAFLRGYAYDFAETPVDGMMVEADEGWSLVTGPEFGCVQWTPKETR